MISSSPTICSLLIIFTTPVLDVLCYPTRNSKARVACCFALGTSVDSPFPLSRSPPTRFSWGYGGFRLLHFVVFSLDSGIFQSKRCVMLGAIGDCSLHVDMNSKNSNSQTSKQFAGTILLCLYRRSEEISFVHVLSWFAVYPPSAILNFPISYARCCQRRLDQWEYWHIGIWKRGTFHVAKEDAATTAAGARCCLVSLNQREGWNRGTAFRRAFCLRWI